VTFQAINFILRGCFFMLKVGNKGMAVDARKPVMVFNEETTCGVMYLGTVRVAWWGPVGVEHKEALKLYCHKPADIEQRVRSASESIHLKKRHQLNGEDWTLLFVISISRLLRCWPSPALCFFGNHA
jgi:hypothetical protein